jgi:hypothetical protein
MIAFNFAVHPDGDPAVAHNLPPPHHSAMQNDFLHFSRS